MWTNTVIIASTAGFLAHAIGDLLTDIGFRVIFTSNDTDLKQRITMTYPRYIFIENCFMDNTTDIYIQKMIKVHKSLHIVIWTAEELTGYEAARFIYAGAESFFTLREKYETVETIFRRFYMGKKYCPAVVEAVLLKEKSTPIINVHLTGKEIEILHLIDNTDDEIAKKLSVSRNTVLYHKKNLYRKIGKHNKREMIKFARDNNYIPRK